PGAPLQPPPRQNERPSRRDRRIIVHALKAGSMPDGPRYEDDFYAWTQYQAEVLRSLKTRDNRFDREHVAEEIEDLGKSERDATQSQITRVLEQFLKLAHSPADRPRYGWMRSIAEARGVLRRKLSPTLRRDVGEI